MCANFEEKESVKRIKQIRKLVEENTEDEFLTIAVEDLDCPHTYNIPENNMACMNGCWDCWKRSISSAGMKFKSESEGEQYKKRD